MDHSWSEHALIPLVSVVASDDVLALASAVRSGGARAIEIVFRTDYASTAIASLVSQTNLTVVGGTLLTRDDVDKAIAAGANAGVAPHLDLDIVEYCRYRGFPFVPGVASPSEAALALRNGVRVLKVFPAEQLGGADFVRSLTGVYPSARFLVSGGISEDNMAGYLAIKAVDALSGSWMAPRSAVEKGDFEEVSRRISRSSEIVALWRST